MREAICLEHLRGLRYQFNICTSGVYKIVVVGSYVVACFLKSSLLNL